MRAIGLSSAWCWKDADRQAEHLVGVTLEHDAEKWAPVFGKHHAPTITLSGMTIRRKVIPL
jgi:hypothetical protein